MWHYLHLLARHVAQHVQGRAECKRPWSSKNTSITLYIFKGWCIKNLSPASLVKTVQPVPACTRQRVKASRFLTQVRCNPFSKHRHCATVLLIESRHSTNDSMYVYLLLAGQSNATPTNNPDASAPIELMNALHQDLLFAIAILGSAQ